MEESGCSEMLVPIYQTAWCQILEGNNLSIHCRENLRSHEQGVYVLIVRVVEVTANEYTKVTEF
jgi:hypothetical protein